MTLMKAMDNRQHKLRYVIALLIMLIAPIQAVAVYPVSRANIIPLYSEQDSRVEGLVDVTEIKLVGRKLFNANDSVTDLASTLSTVSSTTLVPDVLSSTTTLTSSQLDPSTDSTSTTPTYDSTTDATTTFDSSTDVITTFDSSTDATKTSDGSTEAITTFDSSTDATTTSDSSTEAITTSDSSTDTPRRFSTSSGKNLGEYKTSTTSDSTSQSISNTLTTTTGTDLNLPSSSFSSSGTSQTGIETKDTPQPTAVTQSTTSTQSTLLSSETSSSTTSINTGVTLTGSNSATSIATPTRSLEKISSELPLATTNTVSTSSISTFTSASYSDELQGTSALEHSTKSSLTDVLSISSETSSSERPVASNSLGITTATTYSGVSIITTSTTGAVLDKSSSTDSSVYTTTESSYTQSPSSVTSTYIISFVSETSNTKTSGTEASSNNPDISTAISVSVASTSQEFSATEISAETQQDTSSTNAPNVISVNGATTITLSESRSKSSDQIYSSYTDSEENSETQDSISTVTQTDAFTGNSDVSEQTGYTNFNTLTSQGASQTAFVPTKTLQSINSKSYTSNWLPSVIVTEVSLSTGSGATNTLTTAPISSIDLPEAIFPVSTLTTTTGYTFINIGFKKNFNYVFLVSSYVSTAQIFEFLPDLLQYPFLNNNNQKRELAEVFADVQVMDIMPDYGYTSEYITAVAKVYFPEAYVAKLQHFISDKNSVFYKSPESRLSQLAALINPDIEIASSSTYSGSAQTLTAKYTITSDGVPLTFTTVYQSYAPITATATHIRSTTGFYNSDGSLNNFQEPSSMNKKEREKAIVYFVFMSAGFLIVSVVLFSLIKTVNNIPKVNIRLKHDLEKGTLTPQRLPFIPFLFPDYSASQIESIGTHSSQSQSNSDTAGSVVYNEKTFFTSSFSTSSLTDDPTPGSIITEGTIRYYVDFDGNYFYAGESTTSATSSNTSASSEQVSASINSSDQLSTEEVSLLDNDSINPDDIILDENGDVLIDLDDDPILTKHSDSGSNGSNGNGNVHANQNNELTTTQLKALLKNGFSSSESSNHKDLQQLINFDASGPTTDELIRNNILQDAELHDFLYSANGSDSYNNSTKLATRDTQGDFSSASGTNYFSERNGGRSSDVSDVHVGEIDTLDAEIYLRIKPMYEKPLPTLLRQQTHSKSAHDSSNSSVAP